MSLDVAGQLLTMLSTSVGLVVGTLIGIVATGRWQRRCDRRKMAAWRCDTCGQHRNASCVNPYHRVMSDR